MARNARCVATGKRTPTGIFVMLPDMTDDEIAAAARLGERKSM